MLVHQLLALTLQFGGITRADAWDTLAVVPDFRGVSRAEFDALLAHMLREGLLFESGGRLSMGEAAERAYGRKNFMELYAVFSNPALYRVETPAADRDRLARAELRRQLGREHVRLPARWSRLARGPRQPRERTIRVREAPRGREPTWGGFIPQMLGFELCQRMRRILEADAALSFLHPSAAAAIEAKRADLGQSLCNAAFLIQMDDGKAHCWTFAGGRINHTLKYVFALLGGWKVVADNFQLRVEGDSVTPQALVEILDRMRTDAFWNDRSLWAPSSAASPSTGSASSSARCRASAPRRSSRATC